MNLNATPSERSAILGQISPQSNTVAVSTGLVAIKDFFRLQAIIMVGAITSTGVVNAKLQAAVGSGGTPVDIAGTSITPLTQAGTDSNKVAVIDFNIDKLAGEAYTHVQLVITPSVAAALVSGLLMGFDSRYTPPTDGTFVDEIVTA